MPADALIRTIESLRVSYGFERSVKITPGELADDRCLISVGLGALGETPIVRLQSIGRELGIPADYAAALPAAVEQAGVVHFGYEAAGSFDVYKIYFEYVSSARQAIATPGSGPALVHLAYKWVAQKPDNRAITRYTWIPCRTRAAIELKLRELLPEAEAAKARACTSGLLSRLGDFADSGKLMLMEVEEPGNPRRSCDLNIYDARMTVREMADPIDKALRDFAVPATHGRAVFGRVADRMLGHVAGGLGRDGREFVTIYFGVEAH